VKGWIHSLSTSESAKSLNQLCLWCGVTQPYKTWYQLLQGYAQNAVTVICSVTYSAENSTIFSFAYLTQQRNGSTKNVLSLSPYSHERVHGPWTCAERVFVPTTNAIIFMSLGKETYTRVSVASNVTSKPMGKPVIARTEREVEVTSALPWRSISGEIVNRF
jgi:hypothetical protein